MKDKITFFEFPFSVTLVFRDPSVTFMTNVTPTSVIGQATKEVLSSWF
jgi:hypothetical protein